MDKLTSGSMIQPRSKPGENELFASQSVHASTRYGTGLRSLQPLPGSLAVVETGMVCPVRCARLTGKLAIDLQARKVSEGVHFTGGSSNATARRYSCAQEEWLSDIHKLSH